MIDRGNWVPKKYSSVCSKHFEEICFSEGGVKRVKLRSGSIPTLHMPVTLQPKRKITSYTYREISPVASSSKKIAINQDNSIIERLRRRLIINKRKLKNVTAQKTRANRRIIKLSQELKNLQNLLPLENNRIVKIMDTPDFVPLEPKPEPPEVTEEEKYQTLIEGLAEVRVEKHVFYNPVQHFNRDLSIAVLTVFLEDYKAKRSIMLEKKNKIRNVDMEKVEILEALAATGLRSIRYAKEVPNVTKIIANDLSEQAVETMQYNVVANSVQDLVIPTHDDACNLMYQHKQRDKRFAAVDLDPYGCPSIFLDSAIQCVQDGGLLLVTATDMAVLAGVVPETCFSKYGSVSLKTKSCHEMALRILLFCIEQHANRYSRYIVPLLSIAADFYVRVFVQVFSGAAQCKQTTSKLSMVYHCCGCGTITLQPLGGFKPNPKPSKPDQTKSYLPTGPPVNTNCEHCNQKHHVGGPIWSAPIHQESFVSKVLGYVEDNSEKFGTAKRIEGVLAVVQEELEDVPLYYTQDKLFGVVHLTSMPMLTFRSAILNGGYRVSYSHASRQSVKTDAPPRFVWDVVRRWEKLHPVKAAKKETDPVTRFILFQEITSNIDLSEREDANPSSRKLGRLRFQKNPEPHWGPGTRARVNTDNERQSKAVRNQNKNKDKRRRSPLSDDESRKRHVIKVENSDNSTIQNELECDQEIKCE